jgi:hypothetical protein
MNDMRTLIKVLQEDCKSLASALTQICNTGADVGSVLQTLPPNLVQVLGCCGWGVPADAGAPSKQDSIARWGLVLLQSSLRVPKSWVTSQS